MAGLLQQRLTAETDGAVKSQLEIALARLQLVSPQPAQRLAAIALLGHSGDPETQALLTPYTDARHEPDPAIRAAAQESLSKIQHRLLLGDLLGQAFMGLSLGSVLLLAALGLAIHLRSARGDQYGPRRDADDWRLQLLAGSTGRWRSWRRSGLPSIR
ncbi:Urea ABC transporter [Klebsiella michiganensis]|uniref:Urea ABC transporter n=1 Tax=Klebsiella michiganensis TaxID=1134687 RepID=A0A7H4MYI6_9ENTR|nr:Urea ABC transporter [Klebsiella michiganensis]